MQEFFSRRKRLVASAAVGVAGAAAAYYYWWKSPETASIVQGTLGDEPDLWGEQAARTGQLKCDHAHIPYEVAGAMTEIQPACHAQEGGGADVEAQQEEERAVEGHGSIDASMHAHFSSIQDAFVPAETHQLVQRLQGKLEELTDVVSHVRRLPPTVNAQEKLRLVVRLCVTHAFGSIWLLSVVDAFTRAKLNIIGRHLFLQEKLAKLAQPPPPASLWPQLPWSPPQGPLQPLPPPTDPRAVEAFLACDSFAAHGAQWLLCKVLNGVEVALRDVSVTADMGPRELLHFLGTALVAVDACVSPSTVNWADVLVGTDAMTQASKLHLDASALGSEPHQATLAATVVEELHVELRDVLCSRVFGSALRASVQHTFKAFASQLSASLAPSTPASCRTSAPLCASSPSSAAMPGCHHEQQQRGPQPMEAADAGGWDRVAPGSSLAQGEGGSACALHEGAGLPMQQPLPCGGSAGVYVREPSTQTDAPSAAAAIAAQQPPLLGGQGGKHGAVCGAPRAPAPRVPLVRSAKQIRASGEALLTNLGPLTKELSSLKPLMALSANVFAASTGSIF